MFRFLASILSVMCFLAYGCKGPPSTGDRAINQTGEKGTLKVCLERAPAFYNAEEDSRLKAALPLAGKTEAEAEASVQAYLRQEAGGTKRGQDLQDYMNHICLMANNGNWSNATTVHLIELYIDKFGDEEAGTKIEQGKPKVEITFDGLSQQALLDKFPLPLVLEPSRTAVLTFAVTNVGNGPALNPFVVVTARPEDVIVDRRGEVYETKPNHFRYQIKAITLNPKEIAGSAYGFTVEVLVPDEIDAFVLLFRIFGDNLPHNDLVLNFKAIHYKRPGGG